MAIHQVRLARGQKLYQGRPKFSITGGQNGSLTETFSDQSKTSDTHTYTRPFKTYPTTPSPKAAEDVDNNHEGPKPSKKHTHSR